MLRFSTEGFLALDLFAELGTMKEKSILSWQVNPIFVKSKWKTLQKKERKKTFYPS